MKKSIIILAGRSETGKSSTLKLVLNKLEHIHNTKANIFQNDGDILATLIINGVKIGIETQGDPGSRVFNTLETLMDSKYKSGNCDIVVCASRFKGKVKNHIVDLSKKYKYEELWNGVTITNNHNIDTKNSLSADYIISQVSSLMSGHL